MKELNEQRDWSKTTWEGARREELRRWRSLSLREKFAAVDTLQELGNTLIEGRQQKGLPYFDPITGGGVTGDDDATEG